MKSVYLSGASEAPSPSPDPQAARVAGRVNVSPAMAATIAGLAWGSRRRDQDMLLVAVTANRIASYAEVQ